MSFTFQERASAGGGQTTGFDCLRIGLSLAVLLWHCFAVSHYEVSNTLFWAGPFRALPAAILPMFFALSGFLVAGSLSRVRLHQFALLRVLRIIPALAFETILVALVLGTTFTVLPLKDYFTSPEFFAYFRNIVGDIHYTLPGVFNGQLLNAQLWTIPSELECYLALIVLAVFGFTRRRRVFAAGLILGALGMTAFSAGFGEHGPYAQLGGRVLVFSFLAGVLAQLYQDKIRHDVRLFLASLALMAVMLSYRELSYLAAFPAAYATVWLGLLMVPRIPFGDLSYGVFLFHFPIILTVRHCLGDDTAFLTYLAIVVPLSAVCAAISWICIEKPILMRKWRIIEQFERLGSSIWRAVANAGQALTHRA